MRYTLLKIGPAVVVSLSLPLWGQTASFDDPFNASVPEARASGDTLALSLDDAIARSLKSNLGLLVRANQASNARADRLRALAQLLPEVYANLQQVSEQISLS